MVCMWVLAHVHHHVRWRWRVHRMLITHWVLFKFILLRLLHGAWEFILTTFRVFILAALVYLFLDPTLYLHPRANVILAPQLTKRLFCVALFHQFIFDSVIVFINLLAWYILPFLKVFHYFYWLLIVSHLLGIGRWEEVGFQGLCGWSLVERRYWWLLLRWRPLLQRRLLRWWWLFMIWF